MRNCEDFYYALDQFSAAQRIAFIDIVPYNYRKAGNEGSLTKTSFYPDRLKLQQHIHDVMLDAMPDRNVEIEQLLKCQDEVVKIKMCHSAMTNGLPLPFKLKFSSVFTILRLSSDYREKVSALLMYFCPRPLYLFAFKQFSKQSVKGGDVR